MKTFQEYIDAYDNSSECHAKIIQDFEKGTNSISWLKDHRDFIENKNKETTYKQIWGHGDRCLQYMWKLIVDTMPEKFAFLEIGVYKGQILSLIELCAQQSGKKANIVGVTPLYDPDFAKYDRMPFIKMIYAANNVTMDNTTIIDGRSQKPDIINKTYSEGPYDIVYVDGDHSYEATVLDIQNFDKCLKPGGLMLVDDASNFKNIPRKVRKYKGILEVSKAVRDTLEQDENYKELLTCMHVRIFRKK